MARRPGRPRKRPNGIETANAGDGERNSVAADEITSATIAAALAGTGTGTEPDATATADAGATVTFADPGTGAGAYTEPVTGTEAGTDTGTFTTAEKRKRGRPAGSKNTRTLDISGLEKSVYALHLTLAQFIPEMELDSGEAHKLAEAYTEVGRHYPAMLLPDKYMALITFAGVAGAIYLPRAVALRMRLVSVRPQPRRAPPANPAAQNPPTPQSSPLPENSFQNGAPVPREARVSVIPGIGEIELPENDPLFTGKRH